MKTSPLDFILGFSALVTINLACWFISMRTISPLLEGYLKAYLPIFDVLLYVTLFGIFAALILRTLLWFRPLKMGEFDFNSVEFAYWKFITMLHYFGYRALFLFHVEPMIPFLGRLFGAKIGANAAIGGILDSPYLVTIGDNCILGRGSLITGNLLLKDKLILGPVKIKENAMVGVYSIVMPNAVLGQGSVLAPSSVLFAGSKVPDGESWKGHPARKWI